MSERRRGHVTRSVPAGPDHQVNRVEGGRGGWRRKPCAECPWLRENSGSFPPDAFRASASTAKDMAMTEFACHMSKDHLRPDTCAGFLMRGADHNLSVRLGVIRGRLDPRKLSDPGDALHDGYVSMAVANGVPREDPALQDCRLGRREDGRGVASDEEDEDPED